MPAAPNSPQQTPLPNTLAATAAGQPFWRQIVETLLIFAVFSLHGAWPVPDVNESHYLSKAKHYWNPDWCRNDFFCNTADAHQVFYWTFGWTARFLSLPAVAWIGRLITWALLAFAWRRLSWAALPRNWLAILSAVLFVSLNENAHMAGEWVVGGVEAKGFAYVLVFLGFEAVLRGKWNWAWLLLGAATGIHAIVGGWSAVAGGAAWLADRRERQPIVQMLPWLFGGLVLASPGIWFGLALTHGVDSQTIANADAIYVWQRLPHHLSADHFQIGFPSRHMLLWIVWLLLLTISPADGAKRRFRWMVSTAMLLAGIGYCLVLVSHWNADFAASMLRYYWFRMSDVFIPLGVTLVGLNWLLQIGGLPAVNHSSESSEQLPQEGRAQSKQSVPRPRSIQLWWAALILIAIGDLALQFEHFPAELACCGLPATTPRADKEVVYDDWRDVCRWAAEHTDRESLFLTPRMSQTFRWYAGRAEVVNWKDIPQNAEGIVEWWRRLGEIWGVGTAAGPIQSLELLPPPRLADLAAKYKAEYAVIQILPGVPRLALKELYSNNSYAVYRFSPLAK
jgi:hypothetical protein